MTEPATLRPDELAGLSFEEAYLRLEKTVAQLEQGELSLTDSESLYRQGMELAQYCQQLLTEAELRITQVGDNRDAPPPLRPPPDDDGAAAAWEPPPPLDPDDPALFDNDNDDDDLPF